MDQLETLAYLELACGCGCDRLMVLGYPEDDDFLGPLAVRCSECHELIELMNPSTDGHNGELHCSSTRVGSGPRELFRCGCGNPSLELYAGFSYQGGDDYSEAQRARLQDWFDDFSLYGKCSECGELAPAAGYECA